MTTFASARDRTRGALLAAAAGDALGWPQETRGGIVGGKRARESRRPQAEFTSWVRSAGSRFTRYQDPVDAGAYSDDTQLMLAVARSCMSADWVRHFASVELPAWPFYQRGGGRAVLRAASAWAENRPPWIAASRTDGLERTNDYFRAGANGVAMRIAPHVLWTRFSERPNDSSPLFERVVRDGILTHGHPRALVGATVYAAALDFALESTQVLEPNDLLSAAHAGMVASDEVMTWLPAEWFEATSHRREDFAAAWDRTNEEMAHLLGIVYSSLRRGSMSHATETLAEIGAIGEFAGSGTISAAAAIYLASRSGTRPISGLLQGAFQHGADTDTVASMTGGLLGAIHGHDWLGQLRNVQDAHYLTQLADGLAKGRPYEPGTSGLSPKSVARELETDFHEAGVFVDGRRYEVIGRAVLSERPWAARFHLQLEDGQTAIVDRVHRDAPVQSKLHDVPPTFPPLNEPIEERKRNPKSAATSTCEDRGIAVTLPVADVEAIAKFYSDICGATLRIENNIVEVSRGLRFAQSLGGPSLWSADALIDIRTEDLLAVGRKLNASIVRDTSRGDHILAIDPDGRSVTVRQRER